jgi:hypothetical protein
LGSAQRLSSPRTTASAIAVDRAGELAREGRVRAAASAARDAKEPDEDREKRVYLEQVTLLYQQAFPAAFVNVSVAALVVYTYYGAVPQSALAAWVALVGAATAVTSVIIWQHHRCWRGSPRAASR